MKKFFLTTILAIIPLCAQTSTFIDERDGQVYKIVSIGKQQWMAENLKYKVSNSYCLEGKQTNCDVLGRLYTWEVAQQVCPEGFHLPSKEEYKSLNDFVNGNNHCESVPFSLKSSQGWGSKRDNHYSDDETYHDHRLHCYDDEYDINPDRFGFSALPGRYRNSDGQYLRTSFAAYFWTSTPESKFNAYSRIINSSSIFAEKSLDKKNALSIRCLKDEI